jgi:hypothetical protein
MMAELNSQWVERLAAWIEAWPRILRIGLSLVITALVVLVAWGVLAELVGSGVADPNPSPALSLIVILLGMLIYVGCWAALVGFENQPDRTWHAGQWAVYVLAVGVVSLVVVVVSLVTLLA